MSEAFDQRADNLQQGADVIRQIAISHCGVSIDDLTHERWKHIIGLMRDLDSFYDQPNGTISESMQMLSASDSPYFNRYPTLFPDQMETEAYQKLLQRARAILHMGQLASETTDLEEFVSYRTLEARFVANLFADSASPHVTLQSAFSRDFMPLAQTVAIGGNFYDSFVDAHRDYPEGRLHVRPDIEFYKRVGSLAVQHTIPSLGVMLHPPVVKELFIMAKYRMINKALYDNDGNLHSWLPGKPRGLSAE